MTLTDPRRPRRIATKSGEPSCSALVLRSSFVVRADRRHLGGARGRDRGRGASVPASTKRSRDNSPWPAHPRRDHVGRVRGSRADHRPLIDFGRWSTYLFGGTARILDPSVGGTGACGLSPARRHTRSPRPSRRANGESGPPSLGAHVPEEQPMSLIAVAFPILPGKTEAWREWMAEVNGSRREEFDESRRSAGVHERTFLQSTPMGDVVIVTLEGDDPGRAFGKMLGADNDFATVVRREGEGDPRRRPDGAADGLDPRARRRHRPGAGHGLVVRGARPRRQGAARFGGRPFAFRLQGSRRPAAESGGSPSFRRGRPRTPRR